MGKLIYVPDSVKKEIEQTFKTTKVTLWSALNFKTNSDFARMLRAAALQRGGVVYDSRKASPGYLPDCITTFETTDKTMTQKFGDRVYLTADLMSGDVILYADGTVVSKHARIALHQLCDIQASAQQLANQLSK